MKCSKIVEILDQDIDNATEKELQKIDSKQFDAEDLRIMFQASQKRIKKLEDQHLKDKSELLALRKIVEDLSETQKKIGNLNFYELEEYLKKKIK